MSAAPHHSTSEGAFRYRSDIDGLRAIAVLAVVFYHVGLPGFTGGYVGVDVFLVISGYLISGILFKEYDRTGNIALGAFYFRRLKRIAPALVATAAVTSVGAVYLYAPALLAQYGQSLWMAILSISNIGFYQTSGYFGTDAVTKPLLHTWSLSVEEQFYLIWPLCLLWMMRIRHYRFHLIAALTVVSLTAAQLMLGSDPEAVFFLMPFRICEFAIGTLLHADVLQRLRLGTAQRNSVAGLGLSAILVSTVWYTEATPFPGLTAFAPCLGAAAIIWAEHGFIPQRLIGNRVMVWIGRVSYALYLVHWPLFLLYERYRTFVLFRTDALTLQEQVLLVIAAFGLAALLHYSIEAPFRTARIAPRWFVAGMSTAMVVCALVGVGIAASGGLPERAWLPDSRFMAASYPTWLRDRLQKYPHQCKINNLSECSIPPASRRTALIIGNSHVIDGVNVMRVIAPDDYFVILDTNGCGADPSTPNTPRCRDLANTRFNPAFVKQFDYVVYSRLVVIENIATNQQYLDFLAENSVARVVVFSNYLRSTVSFDDALQMYGTDETRLRRMLEPADSVNEALATTAARHGFLFVDKYALLCGSSECPLFTPDGVPFSYDKHHLTLAFARFLGSKAAPQITAYLAQP